MTSLQAGNLWHKLNKYYTDKYHNGTVQWKYRFGFDVNLLTKAELMRYIMVYTATMESRGYYNGLENKFFRYLNDIVNSNTK